MTAHDVHLTDLVKTTANVLHKAPLVTAPTPSSAQDDAIQTANLYRDNIKRALDIALTLIAVPIVLPLVTFMALLVAMTGGKPFYSQDRIGKNGRTYRIWKLRSMVQNADDVLEEHLASDPAMRAEWDSKQKLLDDPRITSLGHIMRKCSIDELPQLWNVLCGDMSLVGPRPMMVSQKDMYPGDDYYDLRPGITGFWQISDRNGTTFADRARYDARYNEELSFTTDAKILLGTVRVVVRGTGH
ncbi:MAG: sugar transferase [Aliishimia sp.]